MSTFRSVAYGAVIAGDYIPAHDETTDLAESIGEKLDAFRAYVASVRDAEQAEAATAELLAVLLKQVQQPEHTFRVVHAHSGKVAYDGPSFTVAGGTQYRLNVEESSERREPLWRMWIVDIDGVPCTVNTQQETR